MGCIRPARSALKRYLRACEFMSARRLRLRGKTVNERGTSRRARACGAKAERRVKLVVDSGVGSTLKLRAHEPPNQRSPYASPPQRERRTRRARVVCVGYVRCRGGAVLCDDRRVARDARSARANCVGPPALSFGHARSCGPGRGGRRASVNGLSALSAVRRHGQQHRGELARAVRCRRRGCRWRQSSAPRAHVQARRGPGGRRASTARPWA
jgi:hypothetical protein